MLLRRYQLVALCLSLLFFALPLLAQNAASTDSPLGTVGGCRSLAETPAWRSRLALAGLRAAPDTTFSYDDDNTHILFVPCSRGEPQTGFSIMVGPPRDSTQQQLDALTPSLIRLALARLHQRPIDTVFSYVEAADDTSASALRDAFIKWVKAASWSEWGPSAAPQPLPGVKEWLVVAARTRDQGNTSVLIGLVRGHLN